MKRFFFSLIALSAVAVGCTQSALLETPDFGGTEITFSPYTGRTPVTKATSVENPAGLANASASAAAKADPNGFYVYGFLNQKIGDTQTTSVYLDNKKVYSPSKGQTANDWTYDGLVYWPTSEGSSLDFVAYSANGVGNFVDSEGNSTDSEGKPIQASSTGFTFKVPNTIDQQVDLLVTAYQAGNTLAGGSSVNLKFHHLLSRVGFKVQSTTSKEVTITDLTFTGDMPTQGTLDFDAAIVKSATDKAIPELQPTVIGTPEYDCLTGDAAPATSGRVPGTEYLMIMPHIVGAEYEANTDNLKGSDHHIDVTYVIEGSEDKTRTSRVTLPIGFEFAAGKAYEIVLKISTSSLTFDVQEEDWNSKNNDANINPNEPPVPDEEEEEDVPEEEPFVAIASVEFPYATLSVSNVYSTSARLSLYTKTDDYKDVGWFDALTINLGFVTIPLGGFGVDNKDIGIAIRQKNSTSWNLVYTAGTAPAGRNLIWVENDLLPNTIYECCVYTNSREYQIEWYNESKGQAKSVKYLTDWQPQYNEAQIITFITPSEIIYPSFLVDDVNTSDIVSESDNQFKATLHGSYTLGSIDGSLIKIKEYGFCWVMGNGTPTTMDEIKSWPVSTSETYSSYDMVHEIPNLKPNTTYSYCAYVIAAENRTAYETSPSIVQEKITITHKDEIIYSPVYSFTTGAIVNNNNNTDGTWGSSDSDTETEFKPKR